MSIVTGSGATIHISASSPATFTQSGYEALTHTKIGNVKNLGNPPARVYQVVEDSYLEQRGVVKGKGSYNLGQQTITITPDTDDAGQILLKTATNSDDPVSVKIVHPKLGTIYAMALVMGGPLEYGDNNTPVSQQITLEYTIANSTTDGVIVVPPS